MEYNITKSRKILRNNLIDKGIKFHLFVHE
jgi:hypothetical protein